MTDNGSPGREPMMESPRDNRMAVDAMLAESEALAYHTGAGPLCLPCLPAFLPLCPSPCPSQRTDCLPPSIADRHPLTAILCARACRGDDERERAAAPGASRPAAVGSCRQL